MRRASHLEKRITNTIPTQPLLGSDFLSSPSNPALRSCSGRSLRANLRFASAQHLP